MPRYKVIADFIQWSVFKYKIGDILYKKGIHFVGSGSARGVNENEIDLYPAIFRKLNWWEERKVEDMPEYVKGIVGYFKDKIYKIAHPAQNGREWHVDNEIEHRTFVSYGNDFTPATEQEYNDYINSSNAKP